MSKSPEKAGKNQLVPGNSCLLNRVNVGSQTTTFVHGAKLDVRLKLLNFASLLECLHFKIKIFEIFAQLCNNGKLRNFKSVRQKLKNVNG